MCLAVPGKIIEITGDMAVIELAGITCGVNIGLVPDIAIGEWCLVHTGFVIQRLSAEEAEETLKLLREYVDLVPEMLTPSDASSLGGG